MSTFKRSDRIAGIIQRKLSVLIQQELKDPGMPSFLTISAVKVTPDLSLAKIYFTVLNEDIAQTTDILNASAGFLRKALARTMTTRTVPELHFIYDESIEYGRKLTRLIDELNQKENNDQNESDESKGS